MKKFCPSCGFGTEYSAVKPTKCGKCGIAFEASIVTPAVPKIAPVSTLTGLDDLPEPQNFDPTSVTALSFEIRGSRPGRGVTMDDLVKGGKPTIDPEPLRRIPRKVDKDAVLKDLLPNRHLTKPATVRKTKTKARR